ncbi:hypothetical protein IE4771_CH03012 [Rhizobium etli bv. mimosae str. IE4771]|uniref:Uncharacterized protein n=1 Tax=Rhizobium etli bv. mimosae str. IE4771 TaxID=1432050 RepID=A0A060I948_RHIET|nr:hypothetical protein IE4771_CH03012 [Rhizobium sp. IE4771]
MLDVPDEAASVHFGFFLKGHGKVWARNFRIEVVSDLATATNMLQQPGESKRLPSQPINLDFDADAA